MAVVMAVVVGRGNGDVSNGRSSSSGGRGSSRTSSRSNNRTSTRTSIIIRTQRKRSCSS